MTETNINTGLDPLDEVKGLIKDKAKQHQNDVEKLRQDFEKKLDEVTKNKQEPVIDDEKQEKLKQNDPAIQELTKRMDQMQAVQKSAKLTPEQRGDKPEEKAKFERFLRTKAFGDTVSIVEKDLRSDSNEDGGYLVLPEFDAQIGRLIREVSPIRQEASVVQTSATSRIFHTEYGGAGYRWTGEGESNVETSTPQIDRHKIELFKLEAMPWATIESLEDPAISLESWLMEHVTREFQEGEAEAFVGGDGVGQPRGFLSYQETNGATEERNKFREYTLPEADFANEMPDLCQKVYVMTKSALQGNAKWYMSRQTYLKFLELKDADGHYFLTSMKDGSARNILFGKPIVLMDNMPEPTINSLAIAYGDMRQAYTILERKGMTVQKDYLTRKGMVGYYTTKRVGGGVTNFQALSLIRLTA